MWWITRDLEVYHLQVRPFLMNAMFEGNFSWPVASWSLHNKNYAVLGTFILVKFLNGCWDLFIHAARGAQHIAPVCNSGKTIKDTSRYRRPRSCPHEWLHMRLPWILGGPPQSSFLGVLVHQSATVFVCPGLWPQAWTYDCSLNVCGNLGRGVWRFCFS